MSNNSNTNHRYHIINTHTNNTLTTSDGLMRAVQLFHNINKRKHGKIILLDMHTGEILKDK